jgi:hypothetical protein
MSNGCSNGVVNFPVFIFMLQPTISHFLSRLVALDGLDPRVHLDNLVNQDLRDLLMMDLSLIILIWIRRAKSRF